MILSSDHLTEPLAMQIWADPSHPAIASIIFYDLDPDFIWIMNGGQQIELHGRGQGITETR